MDWESSEGNTGLSIQTTCPSALQVFKVRCWRGRASSRFYPTELMREQTGVRQYWSWEQRDRSKPAVVQSQRFNITTK
ncbi:hypothetical protein AAFF_G00079800 [Aldrovandia affinis]|uniref:Uncharacterized protein n=1 Tax=Aldrovandia affinis TaxID=143900 RepID=A0AAD7WDP8_9TELE|nr:hypothetical protein AAFF_G00079800 [Aldrovandia affinis]